MKKKVKSNWMHCRLPSQTVVSAGVVPIQDMALGEAMAEENLQGASPDKANLMKMMRSLLKAMSLHWQKLQGEMNFDVKFSK